MKRLSSSMLGILLAICTATCGGNENYAPRNDLRQDVTQHGAPQLVERLRRYPQSDAPAVRSTEDFQFLYEIVSKEAHDPVWLSASPDIERARSLAAYYLGLDHANRHFRLSGIKLTTVRNYVRAVAADSSTRVETRREALSTLGAVGDTSDISRIENMGLQSAETDLIRQSIISLALMCQPSAGDAMKRVLAEKGKLLKPDFVQLALDSRETRQRSICGKAFGHEAT